MNAIATLPGGLPPVLPLRGASWWRELLDALDPLYREILFLPEQASGFARDLDHLHYFEITVMFALAGLVTAAAVFFCIRYRRRSEDDVTPEVTTPGWLQALTYGGLLTFFVLLWAVGFRQYLEIHRSPADAVDVYVTAKQWMWKFAYPEGARSVGALYVPVGRKTRLLLTSRDVIHSFYVPELRLKRDAVPGTYTTAWFEPEKTGRFPILCAELCGTGHSRMRGELVVLRPEEYHRWLRTRLAGRERAGPASGSGGAAPTPRLVEAGRRKAAELGCLSCHTLDGSPHVGPTWRGLYGSRVRLESGETVVADPGYLTESMMDPRARLVAGYPPVMPSYRGQVGPAEVAAIVEFLKTLAAPGRPGEEEPGGR